MLSSAQDFKLQAMRAVPICRLWSIWSGKDPMKQAERYLQALACKVHAEALLCLLPQPWQPSVRCCIWHVANAKRLEDDAFDAALVQVPVSHAGIAARNDWDADDVGIQLQQAEHVRLARQAERWLMQC